MLQKGASCLCFLGHTSTWCPAEVKGDTFSVSSLCDAGDAETRKLGPAHSCYALQVLSHFHYNTGGAAHRLEERDTL